MKDEIADEIIMVTYEIPYEIKNVSINIGLVSHVVVALDRLMGRC